MIKKFLKIYKNNSKFSIFFHQKFTKIIVNFLGTLAHPLPICNVTLPCPCLLTTCLHNSLHHSVGPIQISIQNGHSSAQFAGENFSQALALEAKFFIEYCTVHLHYELLSKDKFISLLDLMR